MNVRLRRRLIGAATLGALMVLGAGASTTAARTGRTTARTGRTTARTGRTTARTGRTTAGAPPPPAITSPPPPAITSTSLIQRGQDLVWYVRLDRPFSPTSLRRAHLSLCLLIERPGSGTVASRVCAAPGRHDQPPPRLIVTWGTHGRRMLAAAVRRPNDESISASFLPSGVGVGYTRLRWQSQSSVLPPACQPSGPCPAVLSPARPRLLKLHIPKLVGCVASGAEEVFQGPRNVHDIALTFDDGPSPDPPSIDFVNELARLHVPGTFFEIGEQIGTYDPRGTVERAMLAHGDMIGDHTWTHPDMLTLSSGQQRSQIASTAEAIRRATGFRVCLFRPPYGAVDSELTSLVRSMGMTTIMWNDDTRDWSLPGVPAIEGTALAEATNGGIVLMHFGGGPRYETLAALPDIVSTLRQRGYRFVTVTQLLGYQLIYK